MRQLVTHLVRHLSDNDRKVIILTFELFWITVFLLEAAASQGGAEIASFVYANF
jgi:hypothetical protein